MTTTYLQPNTSQPLMAGATCSSALELSTNACCELIFHAIKAFLKSSVLCYPEVAEKGFFVQAPDY